MQERYQIFYCGLSNFPVTLTPYCGGFKSLICLSIKYALLHQEGLTQEQLDFKPNQSLEPLQTSISLELHFTAPVRRAQCLSQEQPWPLHNLFEELNSFTTSKPSRRHQPPRVTSQDKLNSHQMLKAQSKMQMYLNLSSHPLLCATHAQMCGRTLL